MSYLVENPGIVLGLLFEHLAIVASALAIAVALALAISLFIVSHRQLASIILGILGTLYTIPSIALIILLLPIFGLNATSVVIALVIYSQVILVRNMVAGLEAIDPAVLEAARGMGMNAWQQWWRIKLPLALPILLAGARIAAVVAIGIATIGAKFSAGGLGRLLFDGVAQGRYDKIVAGALAVSALALAVNLSLLALERAFDPIARIRRAQDARRIAPPPFQPNRPPAGVIPTAKPG